MKANKFFAAAMAAMMVVGFASCDKNGKDEPVGDKLTLSAESKVLKVGESFDLLANKAATFEASKEGVVELIPANDGGKTVKVVALAEGGVMVSAKAGAETAICVVTVTKSGDIGGAGEVKGSQIWTIIMDEATAKKNQSKIVAAFSPDDVNKFLYVWDGTYKGETATGLNFHGQQGYLCMSVAGDNYGGMGYFLSKATDDIRAAEALRKAIVANPDDYFFHVAIKGTEKVSSWGMYTFNTDATGFALGTGDAHGTTHYQDYNRDGSWQEFDIPCSKFAKALSEHPLDTENDGCNMFVVLANAAPGTLLNLDAVYFYKK